MKTTETKKFDYKRLYVSREESHSHFGGYIYFSDFNTDNIMYNSINHGSEIADRIISDLRFDRYCKKRKTNK